MAALDYGMALARGLIAPQKELQAEVKKLAGNSFRTDEWWNKQLDRQIKEGIRQYETGTEYKTKSGDYVLGKRTQYRTQGYAGSSGTMQTTYTAPKDAVITGYNYNQFYSQASPRYDSRSVQVLGPDTKDLTIGQLKAIENQSKDTSKKIKSAARRSSKAEERKVRGTGGLMGRVKSNDRGLSAKLPELGGMGPELGSMGLGINKTFLG
jgi:hypothetical protein